MYIAMKVLTQRLHLLQLSQFHGHWAGTLFLVLILTVVVTACGGEETTDGGNRLDSESSPRSVPGSSQMSLQEYASLCADFAGDEIAQDATGGEVSEELARAIELMESINPPPEVANWHNESLSYGKAVKRLVDLQPEDETPNPFVFLILLPQVRALEDTMNDLAPAVRVTLAAAGCLEYEAESVAEGDGPSTITFAAEGPANRVTWTSVPGAEFYKVYYGDLPDCYVNSSGSPSSCRELASNVAGTTYVHADPHRDLNYYWVSACDAGGCSVIYHGRYALLVGETPLGPANPRYERDGTRAVLSWGSSEGATHYKVYFDPSGNTRCSLLPLGGAFGCEELDDNVVGTTYTHAGSAGPTTYWVVACNRGGCSEIDNGNPVEPVVQRPGPPAN